MSNAKDTLTGWQRLDAWLARNDPARLADLNPPASADAIRELERTLGLTLPGAFVDCLNAHDGQRGQAGALFDGNQFLPIRHIAMSWSSWTELLEDGDFDGRVARPDAGIRDGWWQRGWVPFASNGGGDYLCLDLTPAPQGRVGQVIEVLHDVPQRVLVAPSFADWFGDFIHRKTA
ncbi:SMI1/KNR4 family protein [Pseudomonas sp.]|jgi:cell wall assembly regulator SMI1|uniref:SMI1/KNR4 family protein n=1 Tax=Pseudomonas sp. TaxID=306 RepID=UPI0028A99EB2|nr:SMI1/KNR4 family protein [Pseudomonas sp.]